MRCGDAPGRSDDRAVADLDPAELARVTRAKTVGARLLDELCAGRRDVRALLLQHAGRLGQRSRLGAYAAGSAPRRAQRRGARTAWPATSIAWEAWADGGMADADLPRTDQARTAPDGPRQGAARPPARPWTS
ncbi:KR domain-containing protein [Streptomyces sp. KL116D]|uniref:KR domain-containing protein n=1 Tax=Streptomyces sp. KL116D TaxID=3045152 RepID=UPI003556E859